ncbi:MAG: DMT family transporter [Cyclobacteriaceae bacterium]|nr:DMT family transporter [Cyclobacteriaceae bacterium]
MNSRLKVHAALALVSLLFGANYSIAKVVMPEYMGPLGLIALRVPLTTVLFWTFHKMVGPTVTPSKKDLGRFFVSAIFGVAVNQIFFFKGISLTSPIMGSVIMTSTPIIVLIISFFLLGERITWTKSLGIILGATGAIFLVTSKGIDLSNNTFQGNLFVLVNALSYSIYLVIVKPLMAKYDALTVIKWVFFFGCFMVVPFGAGELMDVNWHQFNSSVWFSMAYIILGSTFLAYLLNMWALKHVNPSLVGYYIYLQPLFATAIAVVFRGDILTMKHILFASMIFAGVFMVGYKKKKKISP